MRRTKIVCTIGPACEDEAVLRQMIRSGMNVARFNFSHGTHETHSRQIAMLRDLSAREGANLAILQDLQGPRLRTGAVSESPAMLENGATFRITSRQVPGSSREVTVDGIDLSREVAAGNTILIEDGLIELAVVSTDDTDVICQVVTGGELKTHKGINVPGVTLSVPAITEKDRSDLELGVKAGVDYIAMSFVRSAADVRDLRALLDEMGCATPIIAKIEKHEAVAAFDEILVAADGIMVARGDLGVETSAEDVPLIQKMAIAKCNAAGKPVITATQMLNSMIDNPRPTRAEASDVANAIIDGTDAVMMSGETSIGRYPVLAVRTMARIAEKAENALKPRHDNPAASNSLPDMVADVIGQATEYVANSLDLKAIITMTGSGYSARMIARHRPLQPILAITSSCLTQRQMALIWGVEAQLVPGYQTVDELLQLANEAARAAGVGVGELVAITAGLPVGARGRTNLLNVHTVS